MACIAADLRPLFEAFYSIDAQGCEGGARLQRTPAATATTSANAATMGFIDTEIDARHGVRH